MRAVVGVGLIVLLGGALSLMAPLAASADPPTITGTHSTSTDDATPVNPFTGVTIADDGDFVNVEVLWASANGTLTGGTPAHIEGTPAEASAALAALVFTPTIAVGGDTTFTIHANDGTDGSAVEDSGTVVSVTAAAAPTDIHISATGTGVYGTGAPALTTVISNDADQLTTAPSCGYLVAAPVNPQVGLYPTECSGAAAPPQFHLIYDTGVATVTAAPVVITASDGSGTYGSSLPTITAGYSGLQYGDISVPGTTCASLALAVPSVASNCTGAASPDYTFSYVPGTVTVSPVPLTITPSNGEAVYGKVATITATFSGFVNGESKTVLSTQPSCTTTAGATTPVGVHTSSSSCTGAVAQNYSIGYGAAGSTTITPAKLTITALGQSRVAGEPNGPFSAHQVGYVNGEGISNLSGSLIFTTEATASSEPGDYPVRPSGVSSPNYAISFVPGVIQVHAVTPPSPTPTPTPTASPTPTISPDPTPSPTSSPDPTPASGGFDWLPIVLIAAGAILLAALIALILWRRRVTGP